MRKAGDRRDPGAERSPPMKSLGYYAHFMPEPGSKGRATADGPLVERKAEEMGGLGKCWKKS